MRKDLCAAWRRADTGSEHVSRTRPGKPTPVLTELARSFAAPVSAFRLAYLPVLLVYFASGALGVTAVAETFWVKGALTLTPAELAQLAVWLQLPWSAKMVVSAIVDSVAVAGSMRRIWIMLGAALMATGLVLLATAAGHWWPAVRPEHLYVIGQLLVVAGAVLQEVAADALSAEVVPRQDRSGEARDPLQIDTDLAMVQIQARLAYGTGALMVAAVGGHLASMLDTTSVYLTALIVPALSTVGVLRLAEQSLTPRPLDVRVLYAGLSLIALAVAVAMLSVPLAQEIVLVAALIVIILVLHRLMAELDPELARQLAAIAVVAFMFRAVPTLGEGYRWFGIDQLGFDQRFLGILQLTGTAIGLVMAWLLTERVARGPVRGAMLGLTLLAAALWLPSLALASGAHHWTGPALGLDARALALFDEAAQSPLALVATVPLVAAVARYAPEQARATWFAAVASLMSLAVMMSQLITRYLNLALTIDRGQYDALPLLVGTVLAASLFMPLAALALLWRRLQ